MTNKFTNPLTPKPLNDMSGNLFKWQSSSTIEYSSPRRKYIQDREIFEAANLALPPTRSYFDETQPLEAKINLKSKPIPEILRNHNNCVYVDFDISLNVNFDEKHRILIQYNGDRDYLANRIFKEHKSAKEKGKVSKLEEILKEDKYKERGIDISYFRDFKKLDGWKKEKVTKIIVERFHDEIKAMGVTDEQIARIEDGGMRNTFVRHVGEHFVDELKAKGLNDEQIWNMKEKGRTPEGFTVHHKFPRFFAEKMGVEYNTPENLILVNEAEAGDDYIHAFMDKQIDKATALALKRDHQDLGEHLQATGSTFKMTLAWPEGMVYLLPSQQENLKKIKEAKGETVDFSKEALLKRAEKEIATVSKNFEARQKDKTLAPHLEMARTDYVEKVAVNTYANFNVRKGKQR